MSGFDQLIRDVELVTSDLVSPEARSARLAEFAAEQISEAQAINRAVTGSDTPYEVTVDGRAGAALTTVKPDGVIVAEFELVDQVLDWIGEQLILASPILTGRYMRSHILFLDGIEHVPGPITKPYEEAAFLNMQPYARKIERGLSDQAPDGVYQAIAAVAKRRFGNIARVRFSYRSIDGSEGREERQPAIIVRPY